MQVYEIHYMTETEPVYQVPYRAAEYQGERQVKGGFPSNLGGLQLVKQYMAEEIGVGDGEIIAVSKGLHLYDYAWDLAKMRTNKYNLEVK